MIHNKNYKRQTRQLSDRQKQLISQKLKGRKKSSQHAKRISMGMKNMWNLKDKHLQILLIKPNGCNNNASTLGRGIVIYSHQNMTRIALVITSQLLHTRY